MKKEKNNRILPSAFYHFILTQPPDEKTLPQFQHVFIIPTQPPDQTSPSIDF